MDKIFNNSVGEVITMRLDEPTKTFSINNSSVDTVFYTMVDDGEIVKTEGIIWDHWFENDVDKHMEITKWYWSVVKG